MSIIESLGLDQLPREQRLILAQELWRSLEDGTPFPVMTDAQRQELERRVAEDDASPHDVVPWAEVKARTAAGRVS